MSTHSRHWEQLEAATSYQTLAQGFARRSPRGTEIKSDNTLRRGACGSNAPPPRRTVTHLSKVRKSLVAHHYSGSPSAYDPLNAGDIASDEEQVEVRPPSIPRRP